MSKLVDSILHDYPYPIAKCYERLVGTHEALDRWNQVRYLFEVTLKYSASLAVARYVYNNNPDPKIDAALACLNRPSGGHWSNLLHRCSQYNQRQNQSFIDEKTFAPIKSGSSLAKAHREMQMFFSGKDSGLAKHLTITKFFETFVAYRNRSSGHGSPTQSHIEKITPILEEAIVDLLLHLKVLKEIQLMYVSEIRLDRQSYVHSLIGLMGTSPVALPEYETDESNALVGHNKQLYLSDVGGKTPAISLHPLAIFSDQDVYLLHRSNIKKNVEYICHHTGKFYAADRIFEDFKKTFGAVLGGAGEVSKKFEPEDIYEESVRTAYLDGVLSPIEEQYLLELRDQFEISTKTANDIEARVRSDLGSIIRPQVEPEIEATQSKPKKHDRPKRLLFLSYASVRTGFWADLVSRLASAAHVNGYVFSIVTPPHTGDYNASYTANLVAEIDRIVQMHEPDLLILVPFPSESFSSLFRSRFREIKLPIITLDTEIVDLGPFNDTEYVAPPVIQVDNHRGGELVAELMFKKVNGNKELLRFLVMPGLDGAAHSQARVDGFVEHLKALSPDAMTRVLPAGGFNRKQARKVFEDFLFDVELSRYDGIFCCNDEMALGVYAALSQRLGSDDLDRPFVIGAFNNTVEFRGAMEADHRGLLVGSVDQNLEEYVSVVFSTIAKAFAGEETDTRFFVTPSIYAADSSSAS